MYKIVQAIKFLFFKKRKFYGLSFFELGYIPQNRALFRQVFIHRSASEYDEEGFPVNYERLEFLGDSVISSIVSDFLYKKFPKEQEGFLSKLKSSIVSRESLNAVALKLGFDKPMVTHSDLSNNKHIFGDIFEAFMGALYLDGGYSVAKHFFVDYIIPNYININDMARHDTNYKSIVLEWSQKNKYQLSFKTFPDGRKFCSILLIDQEEKQRGFGASKKEAEKEAASAFCFSLNLTN